MIAVEIRAPVRGETPTGAPRWVHVVFETGGDPNEQIAVADDRLSFDRPPNRHLYELKQRFSAAADVRLSTAELAAFRQGCPRARIDDAGDPDVRVLLGTTEQGSWQLAYLLACLAAAGIGRWRSDVRYAATGQLHDGRFRADLLADKLAVVRRLAGKLVFLAPLEPDAAHGATHGATRGPDPADRGAVVGVSSIAELWETVGSPLAAHADLEALAASLRRSLAPRASDVELGVTLRTHPRAAPGAARAGDAPLILCGGSGAGKTSLLGRLALDAAREPGRFGVDLVLPPVSLRRCTVTEVRGVEPLLGCIGEALYEHGAYPRPPRPDQVRALLSSHRALILFDGLDEVPELHRGALASALDGLLTLCPDHRYVMTDGLSPWFKSARWRVGEILPMSDAQIQTLLAAQPEPTASRLLARPDLRELLRVPLLAVLLAESGDPSGGLETLEQVVHGFVQSRFERWAGDHRLARHDAAIIELIDAARRLAEQLGGRAFTAEEAARLLARPAPWAHDPVSALVACGFLVDGPAGTLEFRHDTVRWYFHAGAIAARRKRLGRLQHRTLTAPWNEVWLRYLPVQLAPEPARRFITLVARHSPALGARLVDTLPDDARSGPVLASIARSARLMRPLSRASIRDFAIYVIVMLGMFGGLFVPRFGFGVPMESTVPICIVTVAVPVWLWTQITLAAGDDDAAFRRLLATTIELRPAGRAHAVLETILQDTARSLWASSAVRGYAAVLRGGTRALHRDPIEVLRDAEQQHALASGILALEHLSDPRVAVILARLIARDDLHSHAAVKATQARARRFPHADFWLVVDADPLALAAQFKTLPASDRGIFAGLLVTLLTSWLLGPWGAVILCWLMLPLAIAADITRAGARLAPGADLWSGYAPWSYVLGPMLLLPGTASLVFALYPARRGRILRTARGIDWRALASEVASAMESALARPAAAPAGDPR